MVSLYCTRSYDQQIRYLLLTRDHWHMSTINYNDLNVNSVRLRLLDPVQLPIRYQDMVSVHVHVEHFDMLILMPLVCQRSVEARTTMLCHSFVKRQSFTRTDILIDTLSEIRRYHRRSIHIQIFCEHSTRHVVDRLTDRQKESCEIDQCNSLPCLAFSTLEGLPCFLTASVPTDLPLELIATTTPNPGRQSSPWLGQHGLRGFTKRPSLQIDKCPQMAG